MTTETVKREVNKLSNEDYMMLINTALDTLCVEKECNICKYKVLCDMTNEPKED